MEDPTRAKSPFKTPQQKVLIDSVVTESPSGRTAWTTDANGNPVLAPTVSSMRFHPQAQVFVPQPGCYCNGSGDLYQESFNQYGYDYRRSPQPYNYYEDPANSDIYLDNIRNGTDVRTTIMLRNVPNKWGYKQFKTRLDEFAFGQYDFSYLRMDFKKHQNIGYGFMNFQSAADIIPLFQGLSGKSWAKSGPHRHRKVSISYAAVQGVDCLVEKFRNSSIMTEFPDYTAKLWYTFADVEESENASQMSSNGSNSQLALYGAPLPELITLDMVGKERPFPGPDNHTKHQRSVEGAAEDGLWSPEERLYNRGNRGGRGGLRGGYRGGRSDYDRGNPHQMQHDYQRNMSMPGSYGGYQGPSQSPNFHPPQQMMDPNAFGHGHGNYQHQSGSAYHNNGTNRGRGRGGGRGGNHGNRGGGRGGFVSNDARNDARVPRTFDQQDANASAKHHGGFNALGGQVYT